MNISDLMRTDVATIESDGTLSQALQRMLWLEIRHLPVLERGSLVGVLSERDLLRERVTAAGDLLLVSQAMSTPARTAHPEDTLPEALKRMLMARVGCLPVVQGGDLVGMVTRTDLLAVQYQQALEPHAPVPTRVSDVMTRQPGAVGPTDTLYLALSIMLSAGMRHLPIVDHNQRVVGLLSDRDIRSAVGDPVALLSGPNAYDKVLAAPVSQLMTRKVVVVAPESPLEHAARHLIVHRVGALPVVDEEERLVGVLSYVDLLRHLAGGR